MNITIIMAAINIVFAVVNLLNGNVQFAANHTLFALCLINKNDIDTLAKNFKK